MVRALLPLLLAFSASSACSLLLPAPLGGGDGNGEGEGEDALAIASVDGDGDALPIDPAVVGDAVPAVRRFRDVLVVTGSGLDAVVSAELLGALQPELEILDMQSASTRAFRVTGPLLPGLYTLLLSTSSSSAQAPVSLLQGEPASPTIVDVVDATPAECPLGGRVLRSVVDRDGDGVFSDDEIVHRSVDCDRGVVRPTVLAVADEVELRATLAELQGRALLAPVTVQLPEAMTLTAVVDVGHVDGRNLTIAGPSSVTVTGFNAFRVESDVAIHDVDLIAQNPPDGSTAVFSVRNARVRMRDVTITGFPFGVFADQSDVELVGGVFLGNGTALTAVRGARITALNAKFTGDETACFVNTGASLNVIGLDAENVGTGVFATFGGVVDASVGSIRASVRGVRATDGAAVRLVDTSVIAPSTVLVEDGATVFAAGTPAMFPDADAVVRRAGTLNWNVAAGAGSNEVTDNGVVLFEAGMTCTPATGGVCSPRVR